MGELLGIPEWLAISLSIGIILLIVATVAWRKTVRQIGETLARRKNLDRAEFLAAMSTDVSLDAADFIWQSVTPCLDLFKQEITPHPDDDLVHDLPIDDEEWSLDWPREWAERQGYHESDLPDWPNKWPVTVRNFGRWLDMGPR